MDWTSERCGCQRTPESRRKPSRVDTCLLSRLYIAETRLHTSASRRFCRRSGRREFMRGSTTNCSWSESGNGRGTFRQDQGPFIHPDLDTHRMAERGGRQDRCHTETGRIGLQHQVLSVVAAAAACAAQLELLVASAGLLCLCLGGCSRRTAMAADLASRFVLTAWRGLQGSARDRKERAQGHPERKQRYCKDLECSAPET